MGEEQEKPDGRMNQRRFVTCCCVVQCKWLLLRGVLTKREEMERNSMTVCACCSETGRCSRTKRQRLFLAWPVALARLTSFCGVFLSYVSYLVSQALPGQSKFALITVMTNSYWLSLMLIRGGTSEFHFKKRPCNSETGVTPRRAKALSMGSSVG